MKKYRNFQCQTCEEVTELRVRDDIKTVTCDCGGKAGRIISAPKCFQNTVGKSPSCK